MYEFLGVVLILSLMVGLTYLRRWIRSRKIERARKVVLKMLDEL